MATAKERTLAKQGKVSKPAGILRVIIDGIPIDVDARTVTIRESQKASIAIKAEGLEENYETRAASRAWIVARRTLPDLEFGDLLDSLTIGDLQEALLEQVEDDSPEA